MMGHDGEYMEGVMRSLLQDCRYTLRHLPQVPQIHLGLKSVDMIPIPLDSGGDRPNVPQSKQRAAMFRIKDGQRDVPFSKGLTTEGAPSFLHIPVSAAHFYPAANPHDRTRVTFGLVLPCRKTHLATHVQTCEATPPQFRSKASRACKSASVGENHNVLPRLDSEMKARRVALCSA
jgi:hypothetical protein